MAVNLCAAHKKTDSHAAHKYYSCTSYNCAAHEDGSRAAHEIELACSTRKITLVSHASSVRVTQQKYKNTSMLPHASVNLEMSYTVCKLVQIPLYVQVTHQLTMVL